MTRQAVRTLVLLAAVSLLAREATGQTALEKVVVLNKKDGSTKTYEGRLKFGPAGLQVMGGEKGEKVLATVSPADVVRYVPGDLPGVERTDVLAQISLEEKKTKADYEKARLGYEEMLKKGGTTLTPEGKRYLEFKRALMTTRVADESGDDEKWAEQADAAVKAWDGFLADYTTGWEVWPAARSATRLLAEMNKYAEAARVWGRLAKNPQLPADLKLEAGIQEIDALIRSGSGAANAAVNAKALGDAAPAGVTKDKLVIYEKAANAMSSGDPLSGVKEIESRLAATKDGAVRGVADGMLGELYLAAKKPRDAMWAFLWVETVYNGDKDEALKAMARLEGVFKQVGDDDRAKAYREKIRRFRTTF